MPGLLEGSDSVLYRRHQLSTLIEIIRRQPATERCLRAVDRIADQFQRLILQGSTYPGHQRRIVRIYYYPGSLAHITPHIPRGARRRGKIMGIPCDESAHAGGETTG